METGISWWGACCSLLVSLAQKSLLLSCQKYTAEPLCLRLPRVKTELSKAKGNCTFSSHSWQAFHYYVLELVWDLFPLVRPGFEFSTRGNSQFLHWQELQYYENKSRLYYAYWCMIPSICLPENISLCMLKTLCMIRLNPCMSVQIAVNVWWCYPGLQGCCMFWSALWNCLLSLHHKVAFGFSCDERPSQPSWFITGSFSGHTSVSK